VELPSLDNFPKIVTCTIEGILEPDDLVLLGEEPGAVALASTSQAVAAPSLEGLDIQRVKEKHHSVARLAAQGLTQRLIATITGYTESYLSVLLGSPAMEDLVTFYRMQAGNPTEVIGEKLRDTSMQAVERLGDRLNEDRLSNQELIALAKLGLDRSGHGPTQKHEVQNTSHIFDHAQLAELNRKAREGSKDYIMPARKALPAPDEDSAA
jgi:hypothetical protein